MRPLPAGSRRFHGRGGGYPSRVLNQVRRRLRPRTRARVLAADVAKRRRVNAYVRARRQPLDPDLVFYESFFGNGVLDNPEAIFRHLLTSPEHAHLHHVWALDDRTRHRGVQAEFADDPRVSFVSMGTPGYWRAVARATWLVNNQTFPQLFAKRPGQVYLNTWHGVPLKHMGLDMAGVGKAHSRNIIRNLLSADYLVSASPYMTDTMYRRAYMLQGLFPNAVLEMGQPRMDLLTAAVTDPAAARASLRARGAAVPEDRRVLLFAPTWRGADFGDPQDDAQALAATCARLRKALAKDHGDDGPGSWVVLLKVHQSAYTHVREALGDDAGFLVDNEAPTNTLLGVTDLLVTDYSSIFVDFLATGRPVVHYVPDLEDYTETRGLYLGEDELPGPVVTTHKDLVAAVREAVAAGPTSASSQDAAARLTGPADGEVTARIVDVVFSGREDAATGPGRAVLRDLVDPQRKRLLIYMGSMLSQGITKSAINLLRNLDYDRYDVTVFWPQIRGRDRAKNVALVDDRARPLPRALTYVGTHKEVVRETEHLMAVGLDGLGGADEAAHLDFWSTEFRRGFGDATFDHLIDFSGYGCYTPFLFQGAGEGRRSIWLHNEMIADRDRETLGEKHLHARLGAVFSTYRHFDDLVSVSPGLSDINRAGLSEFAPADRFRHALNTIDGRLILDLADEPFWGDPTWGTPEEFEARRRGETWPPLVTARETDVAPADGLVPDDAVQDAPATEDHVDDRDDSDDPEVGEDPSATAESQEEAEGLETAALVEEADEREAAQRVEEESAPAAASADGGYVDGRPHRLRPVKEPGSVVFVCVGRLSPAKNHARLVDAFARVHAAHPHTRLWLIGGGALEDDLRAQIRRLGIEDAVHLTGQVVNPYKFMRKADCFVLSSDYEGQPVVILEARVLGLPVVTTAFGSVGDSIPPGAGVVVPRSVDGVVEGMQRFLDGEVRGSTLDFAEYNREAVRQFEAAITGRQA